MSSGSFKNVIYNTFTNPIYLIYMCQEDFAKNTNNDWYAIKPNQLTNLFLSYPTYQPLRSGRIWHKVNF